MPIIAESPPIVFEETPATPTPSPTSTPQPTGTPEQSDTPTPSQTSSAFVERHRAFITKTEQIGSCFKREDLSEFTDQEFADHSAVAENDKYLAKTGTTYCNMMGVRSLISALKRTQDEQEII